MKRIVIFASGNGTNAENLILHFNKKSNLNVVAVFVNNQHAKVLEKAKKNKINCVTFNKDELYGSFVLEKINEINPDIIILAGFLLKFPESIIKEYSNKIVNIHPALLPKYGGHGMYGNYVHQAILDNKEKETGITIHYVNENYDEGEIIFQKAVNIENCITTQEIAEKVHQLEHEFFPEVIENLLTRNS